MVEKIKQNRIFADCMVICFRTIIMLCLRKDNRTHVQKSLLIGLIVTRFSTMTILIL